MKAGRPLSRDIQNCARTTVRLKPKTKELLDYIAEKKHMSQSEIIEALIEQKREIYKLTMISVDN